MTAGASPGPLQSYLINQTLNGGWRRSAPVIFAPLISDGPIVLLILVLLDKLPASFLSGISIVGGVFVFYISWGLWKQWRLGTSENPAPSTSPPGSLWRGVLMNFLSPGPYTFWALVNGPILLAALRQSPAHGISFLTGFYGAFILSMAVLIGVFHQARRLGPTAVRLLTLISIFILVVFGLILLKQGLF